MGMSNDFNDVHPRNRKGEFTDKPGTAATPESDARVVPVQHDEARTDVVIIEGGLVQNDPEIPVLDLDVLDSWPRDRDKGAAEEVKWLRQQAADAGQHSIVRRCDEWLGQPASTDEQDDDSDDVVILEGGLVQNSPRLPVIDRDVMDSDATGDYAVEGVRGLLAEAERLELHETAELARRWLADNDTD